jgi:hypothetical protein
MLFFLRISLRRTATRTNGQNYFGAANLRMN